MNKTQLEMVKLLKRYNASSEDFIKRLTIKYKKYRSLTGKQIEEVKEKLKNDWAIPE